MRNNLYKMVRPALAALTLGAVVMLAGCDPDDPPRTALSITQPTGPAALARYVALGDAMTAGFMDGGLVAAGQLASYPARIAGRLGLDPAASTAPNWFAQPLIAWPGVGTTTLGDPTLVAGVLHWNGTTITPVGITPRADLATTLLLARAYPTPYHNLGIPGTTARDVTMALDSATGQQPDNSFLDIILRNPTFGNVTMLGQAVSQGPTLATVWFGTSEVLAGAMSGQPAVGVNIAPADLFATQLEAVIDGLQGGVEARFGYEPAVVLGNVPPLLSMPYFMPKALFDTVVGLTYPTDESDVAFVLFPWLGQVQGGYSDPLPATATLTGAEAAAVSDLIAAYNAAITDLATGRGLSVADIHAEITELDQPARTHFVLLLGQGMDVATAAATTVFSLDGLHLNNRGQSLAANVFLAAINTALDLAGDDALEPVAIAPWDPTYPQP